MYVINVYWTKIEYYNTLNAESNPICHLLALLGAHHILHVSRIRVNCRIEQITFNVRVVDVTGRWGWSPQHVTCCDMTANNLPHDVAAAV